MPSGISLWKHVGRPQWFGQERLGFFGEYKMESSRGWSWDEPVAFEVGNNDRN